MIGRNVKASPTLKNLDKTHLEIPPAHNQNLAKDIIEVVTGVSSNAITVGGKITAGAIIYTGHESETQSLFSKIFGIASLIASGIDFTLIPLGYLYKFYKGEEIPFNTENNIKWALAGLTLSLAIISTAVAIAGRIISFITAGLAIVVGIASVIKYFYDYKTTAKEFEEITLKIETLTNQIQCDMQAVNHIQNQIRLLDLNKHEDKLSINPLVVQLAVCYQHYSRHCEELTESHYHKNHLERKFIRQKSWVELITNSVKFVLAGLVLAGTILSLNPVTLPVASALLATAAVISLVTIIAKKTIQIIDKRKERENETKRCRHIVITPTSTKMIFKKIPPAEPDFQEILAQQHDDNHGLIVASKPLLSSFMNEARENQQSKYFRIN